MLPTDHDMCDRTNRGRGYDACCARHPKACRNHVTPLQTGQLALDSSLLSRHEDSPRGAAKHLRSLASPEGNLVVTHTTGANLPFARNWWRHLDRATVLNYVLIATDDMAFAAIEHERPGRAVRCPRAIFAHAEGRPVSYRSSGWTRLMFAVPRMVRWVLRAGVNVLWMDTDVVALADPFPHIKLQTSKGMRGTGSTGAEGGLWLASVDGRVPDENLSECAVSYTRDARWGRSTGGWKLCGGLFYVQPGHAALDVLHDWEKRLRTPGAGAKNQPHYNGALHDSPTLRVRTLPCDLFPNGYRYASDAWRQVQQRRPVLVHNNWIKGSDAKLRRFREWGMWLADGDIATNRTA